MAEYNGHKNWNHWNVALWVGNDEGLYRLAVECVSTKKTLKEATELFLSARPAGNTPDGARYTYASVYAALSAIKAGEGI